MTTKRIIYQLDCNWHAHNGEVCVNRFCIDYSSVTRITDVSEDGCVCYRVEFTDGTAQFVFNPNMVYEREEVIQ